jgi:hypothetical protein
MTVRVCARRRSAWVVWPVRSGRGAKVTRMATTASAMPKRVLDEPVSDE